MNRRKKERTTRGKTESTFSATHTNTHIYAIININSTGTKWWWDIMQALFIHAFIGLLLFLTLMQRDHMLVIWNGMIVVQDFFISKIKTLCFVFKLDFDYVLLFHTWSIAWTFYWLNFSNKLVSYGLWFDQILLDFRNFS